MKEIHICSGYNKPSSTGFSGYIASAILRDKLKCTCKATLFENDKWYCKRHAPSKILEREEKSWATYKNKLFKNM